MSEEECPKCKYDEFSRCRFKDNFGALREEPTPTDCMLCCNANFEYIAKSLAEILVSIGAGKLGREFLDLLMKIYHTKEMMMTILKEGFPEIYEVIMEKWKEMPKTGSVFAVSEDDLPPEVARMLRHLKKDSVPGRI